MYDQLNQDYTVAFIAAGIPPIAGALIMCLIYRMKAPENSTNPPCEVNIEAFGKGEMKTSETLMTNLNAAEAEAFISEGPIKWQSVLEQCEKRLS